ncbi:MAG: type II toxin-antitoxin system VapC family toxin [Pyrinomonadaceae bacterium]
MSFLLDTHVFLWALNDRHRLSSSVVNILTNPQEAMFFSAASSWEIAIKWSKGHIKLPDNPSVSIPDATTTAGLTQLPITLRDSCHVADLPFHHRDPFDRLLIAQAMLKGLTIITADPIFKKYDIDLFWD